MSNLNNEYLPFASEIMDIIKHTEIEYTFRMTYNGAVKPGQFFEVSIPKFGEAPISVSGISDGLIDLTIRRVGRVTNEVFEHYIGSSLFLRGPYGNGFELENYRSKELVIVAGGTGVSPVRAVIDHFAHNPAEVESFTLLAGFKSPDDILFRKDFERWSQSVNIIMTVDFAEDDTGYNIGRVTEYIPKLVLNDVSTATAIIVGPPVMMQFSARGLLDLGFREENMWISHERRMCCGIGKCGHCKIGDAYVCVDGPVFNYAYGKNLVD